MKSKLSEIISFLKNPFSQIHNALSRKEKFQYLFWLGFLCYLINIALGIVIVIEKHILSKYGIEIKEVEINFNKVYMIFFIVLVGPFYEELIFRLSLSFRKKDIYVSLFTFMILTGYILASSFCKEVNINQKTIDALIRFLFLFVCVVILYFFTSISENSLKKTKTSFGQYFVYGSIIIFTLFHLFNIVNFDIRLLPVYILNLLPIFILGTFLSFCRLQFGFFYGLLFHAVWNFLAVLLKI